MSTHQPSQENETEVSANLEPDAGPLDGPDSLTVSSVLLSDVSLNSDVQHPVTSLTYSSTPGPIVPIAPKQKRSRLKIALLVLFVLLLLAGGSGIAAFMHSANQVQPSLHLTSAYSAGITPVGATDTIFQVSGQNFPKYTTVTFLLDGFAAPGSISRQSNSHGSFTSTLTVTAAWSVGKHMLTASAAASKGVTLLIVTPGQDQTPGPNGAPTDSARGTLAVKISTASDSSPTVNGLLASQGLVDLSEGTLTLGVSGKTICGSEDDGQVHTFTKPSIFTPATPGSSYGFATPGYTATFSATCSGTYQSGHLIYTKIFTSYTIKRSESFYRGGTSTITCSIPQPYVTTRLEGTFSNSTSISGTYTSTGYTLHCTVTGGGMLPFADEQIAANTGSWNGTATIQGATAMASTRFLNPSGPSVPALYQTLLVSWRPRAKSGASAA